MKAADQPVITLPETLSAWGTPAFKAVFQQEVGRLDRSQLPLLQAMAHGSQIAVVEIGVMLLATTEAESSIQARAGIFFSSVSAGCSCADDPTPLNENNEYCELLFDIDKNSAHTQVVLLEG